MVRATLLLFMSCVLQCRTVCSNTSAGKDKRAEAESLQGPGSCFCRWPHSRGAGAASLALCPMRRDSFDAEI